MKERSFIDTNILIYSDDAAFPEKQQQATDLLLTGARTNNLILSTQVLQEYFSASTRKLGISTEIAQRKISLLNQRAEVFSIEPDDIVLAIDLHRLHSFSFWDSLIIRMAQKTACTVLYSEDLQHERKLGNLTIINPFMQ